MTTDQTASVLAGITEATTDEAMPRIINTFEHDGQTVTIVEPVQIRDGRYTRGYLWQAITGDYVLTPARPGDADPTRWVPGGATLLHGARLVSTSTVSAAACAANARRVLGK